jgi:hypothetical protein
VSADLAINGLAYLGVALLFVGTFGLVAFAFGDVAPRWRPVAELTIAVSPFLAATILRRRGARMGAQALELAGGLVLPIMALTAFLDGVAVPPNPTGAALAVTLPAVLVVLASAYAWWCRRHRSSMLRFLVAPVLWLAVGLALIGVGQPIPSGPDVVSATAVQVTGLAWAVVISLLLARLRPTALLSAPTLTAALPGSIVVGALALATLLATGWPPVPAVLLAVAGVGTVELLSPRLAPLAIGLVQPLWWVTCVLPLATAQPPGVVGAFATIGLLLIFEHTVIRRPVAPAVAVTGLLVLVGLVVAWQEPWWAAGTAAVLAAWAAARRRRPFELPYASVALDAVAAVMPVVAVAAVWDATRDVGIAVAVGTVIVLLLAWPARAGLLRRDENDTLPAQWWSWAAALTAGVAVGASVGVEPADRGWVAASLAGLALAAAIGPVPTLLRTWVVPLLGTYAWYVCAPLLDVAAAVTGGVVSAIGVGLVLAAHLLRRAPGPDVTAQLGFVGHLLTLVALATSGTGWGLVVALAAATLGMSVTCGYDLVGRSPVGAALDHAAAGLGGAPYVLAAVGAPLTLAAALDQAGVVDLLDPWAASVLALTAVIYASLARLRLPRMQNLLVGVAYTEAVLAAVLPLERGPAAVGLASVIVAVLLVPSELRWQPMVWVAWAAVAPLAGLVAVAVVDIATSAETVAVVLLVVGGLMSLAALAVAVRRGGRPLQPSRLEPALLPPLVLGALESAAALVLAMGGVEPPFQGWIVLSVGTVWVLNSIVAALPGVLAAGLVLVWSATTVLAGEALTSRPWISVCVAASLLVVAHGLSIRVRDARWAVALLVAATVVPIPAGVAAVDGVARPFTLTAVGGLAVAVAARLRTRPLVAVPYAVLGVGLVLMGAFAAGPGWYALSLGLLAVVLVVAATRAVGSWRVVLQAGAAVAALACGLVLVDWLVPVAQAQVTWVAGVGAASTLGWAVAVRARPALRTWALTWGGTGGVALAATLLTGAAGPGLAGSVGVTVSVPLAVATAVVAVAWAVAAAPLQLPVLRWAALVVAFLAQAQLTVALQLSGEAQVAVFGAITVAACGALLLTDRIEVLSAWRLPVLVLTGVATVTTVGVAAAQRPDLTLLAPALMVAAVAAASTGVVLDSLLVQAAAPLLAVLAWIVFASDALGGNPQWYTMPLGFSLLVVAEVTRAHRRLHGQPVHTPTDTVLEGLGVAFLVGASFVQALTTSLAYAAVAVLLGVAVAAWGVLTRVRRRLLAGVVVVLVALAVLILVPLVGLLPAWRGAGLWVAVAVTGVVALLIAASLERGRAAAHAAVIGLHTLTDGWE